MPRATGTIAGKRRQVDTGTGHPFFAFYTPLVRMLEVALRPDECEMGAKLVLPAMVCAFVLRGCFQRPSKWKIASVKVYPFFHHAKFEIRSDGSCSRGNTGRSCVRDNSRCNISGSRGCSHRCSCEEGVYHVNDPEQCVLNNTCVRLECRKQCGNKWLPSKCYGHRIPPRCADVCEGHANPSFQNVEVCRVVIKQPEYNPNRFYRDSD